MFQTRRISEEIVRNQFDFVVLEKPAIEEIQN